jgi:hypothetical protein
MLTFNRGSVINSVQFISIWITKAVIIVFLQWRTSCRLKGLFINTFFIRTASVVCGQSSWLQIQRFRVWFPALPDFLRSSESGMGSTQPRENNWGATWKDSSGSGLENRKINGRRDSLPWPHDTLYAVKLELTSPTSGGRSVGIVRWRTEAPEFFISFIRIIAVQDVAVQ